MSRISGFLILTVLATVASAPAGAQSSSSDAADFVWSKAMPAGASLTIRNVNGPIRVHPATSNKVEVRGVMRSGDASDVLFRVDTSGDDVTVCTLNNRDSETRSCNGNGSTSSWRGRSVRVEFTVYIPANLRLHAATGNGDLTIDRAGADLSAATGNGDVMIGQTTGRVNAATGNGDIEVNEASGPVKATTGNGRVRVNTSSGPVSASTGNGPIDVVMKQIPNAGDMSFTSGSGSISVTLPADYNGEVDMVSGTGSLRSDFPINVIGRLNPQHIRGTIGKGGPLLRMATGSGSLELRKY
jgi:DUF4097 and DUF4098 domain-containing protein YvlB